MSCKGLLLPAAAMLLLSACNTAHGHIGSADTRFGESIKWDMAVQTINPDPVYPPDGALPGDNGSKAAAATKRYRTDSVKPVEDIKTSRSAAASGGGGPR